MSETNPVSNLDSQTTESRPEAGGDAALTLDPRHHELIEPLGVGGMGEVHRCGDAALQRDLAIKVIKAELHGDAAAEERFVREARLTGALQHPGIVPIHHLGRIADGRLYYTMKLVRGRTFAELLRDQADDPERLPRWLAILEKVCQAVAFAHSRDVIHRDLKPANVMVGEFGEVQVMDWGLAKELHAGAPATEPADGPTEAVETAAWVEEAAGLSRAGLALGTPAYMPPEQAAGDWDIVDERADVFALGALLCEILTGQPPYQGAHRDAVLRRARRGDLAEALGRLERCGADAALVQLCRDCLAAEREGRPRNADVVAKQLAAYQADVQERLRRAEVERAAAQVQAREERKRRRLTLALAALGLLLVTGVGGALWWRQRQIEQADLAVSNGLVQADLLAEQARADPLQTDRYQQALEAARVAAQLAESGSEEARRRAAELIGRLEQEENAAKKDRELLATLLDVRGPREGPKYTSDAKRTMMAMAEPTADEQFAAAFRRWGLDVDGTPPAAAAALVKARPPLVVTEVIAALDEWASERRRQRKPQAEWQRLSDLAALLDDDPGSNRRELREILARGRLPLERALGVLSALLRPVPIPVEVPLGRDRARLRQLAEQTDAATEPILGLLTLVRALRVAGEEARAEQLLREAILARPGEVVLHHTLGQLLIGQQPPRWAEAVECYAAARVARPDLGVNLATALLRSGRDHQGLALLARLVQEAPTNPYLHFQQADALRAKGRLDEAMAEYRQAIALDPKFAQAHYYLGWALANKKQLDEAMAEYRQAIALDPKVAWLHNNLGVALANKGRVDEAMAEFRQAIALDPKDALAHYNLGIDLANKGRLDEAMAEFRQAIALDPKFALAHHHLGLALVDKGRWDDAIEACRKAAALDPQNTRHHYSLGGALYDPRRLDDAIRLYRRAIALNAKDAMAHHLLGWALGQKGLWDEAMQASRTAIALDPRDGGAHTNLGDALKAKGRLDAAIQEYRQAIALDPKDFWAHRWLGNALRDKGRPDDAIQEYRTAIALDPKDEWVHKDLADALKAKSRLNEAIEQYRAAIAINTNVVGFHDNLANALRDQGRPDDAIQEYRQAIALDPKSGGTYAERVHQCERLRELDRKLPSVLKGETVPASAAERIEFASLCRQPYKCLHAAAARLYADAFAADPTLAADLDRHHRYDAARSAALAAAGQGADARMLPDKVVVMFRRWALGWLRDDLTAYAALAERKNPAANQAIQQRLTHWQGDPDLAAVRDPQALDRLADSERAAWQALWRDVDELAKRVAKKQTPPGRISDLSGRPFAGGADSHQDGTGHDNGPAHQRRHGDDSQRPRPDGERSELEHSVLGGQVAHALPTQGHQASQGEDQSQNDDGIQFQVPLRFFRT